MEPMVGPMSRRAVFACVAALWLATTVLIVLVVALHFRLARLEHQRPEPPRPRDSLEGLDR